MEGLLRKLASRKFLTALATQVVAVIFVPHMEDRMADAAVRIVGLVVLLLAALVLQRKIGSSHEAVCVDNFF